MLSRIVRSKLPGLNKRHFASRSLEGVLGLKEFIVQHSSKTNIEGTDLAKEWQESVARGTQKGLKVHIETYGCQMNVADSDIVRAVLLKAGHTHCDSHEEADVILTNTCAIREGAEEKIWNRLDYFQSIRNKNRQLHVRKAGYPIIGILGCMAERLKTRLLEEKSVDFVCGPDAYRDIPRLLSTVGVCGIKEANTLLSFEETYADVSPSRENKSAISAFVSIMRGCNNMCTYCIVPFTRGRERSRDIKTILNEIEELHQNGVKEVMLLGQNVNGYFDNSEEGVEMFPVARSYTISDGFGKPFYRSKKQDGPGARFVDLLQVISDRYPDMRIRFTSPHPKDFPVEVFELIAKRPNLCSSLHLPAQSGSTEVLRTMRREYSRETYLTLVKQARSIIPNVSISSDFITGFCNETEEDHKDTLSLLEEVGYDMAFMFAYSLRDKTAAAYKLSDNVPEDVKSRRLQEVISTFRRTSIERIQASEKVGDLRLILVDSTQPIKDTNRSVFNELYVEESHSSGEEAKEVEWFSGRTDNNHKVFFVPAAVPTSYKYVHGVCDTATDAASDHRMVSPAVGDYVVMKITHVLGKTIYGVPISLSTISEFSAYE